MPRPLQQEILYVLPANHLDPGGVNPVADRDLSGYAFLLPRAHYRNFAAQAFSDDAGTLFLWHHLAHLATIPKAALGVWDRFSRPQRRGVAGRPQKAAVFEGIYRAQPRCPDIPSRDYRKPADRRISR